MRRDRGNMPQNFNTVVKARFLQGLLPDAPPRGTLSDQSYRRAVHALLFWGRVVIRRTWAT